MTESDGKRPGRALRVLVIDDDPVSCEVARAVLEQCGHEVTTYGSALGASSKVATAQPDVVVLDVEMPALNGDRIVDLLKDAAAEGLRPRIFLHSGKEPAELEQLAREAGADGAITKSADPGLFLSAFSKLTKVLLTLVLVALTGRPAIAEDDAAPGSLDETALFAEIPSVFAASKYEQKVTEAPAAVSIVTADEIQKFGYRTLAEILAGLQGIFTTDDRNYEYLAVRGFGRPGDYNTRILLQIDGHRVNDPVYENAVVGTEFPVDVDLIERVEVVRGPSSSLYGSNAFLGVVNIVTRRGRDLQGTELAGGAGTENSYLGRASHGRKLDNGMEFLISGTYQQTEGDDRLYFAEFDDPATNNGVVRNADDDQAYRVFANLGFRDLELQVGYSNRNKEVPTASYGTVFNAEQTQTQDEFLWVDLSYRTELGDQWFVSARTYYDRYVYHGDYLYDYGTPMLPDLVLNKDYALGDRWGGEFDVAKRLFRRHSITTGARFDYNLNQDQFNADLSPFASYVDEQHDSVDWGIYLQDEVTILDNLRLNAGVRYDQDGVFGGTVNPRIALIHSPIDTTTLKLLYGTAFRAPTAYELFYDDGGETIVANSGLDPETIYTVELVLEQQLPWHMRLSSSLYYSEIEDLIELVDIGGDVVQFQNISEVQAYGLELLLEGSWENGITGSVGYALQRTEDKLTGQRLTNSPMHLVDVRAVFPLFRQVLFLSPELRYISERKTSSGGTVDGATVVNLTLLNRNWIPGLEIQASIMNFFDEEYFDPGSEDHAQNGIVQRGRSFFAKLTYSF